MKAYRYLLALALTGILSFSCNKEDTKTDPDPDVPTGDGTEKTPGMDMFYKGSTMCFASYFEDAGLVYREDGEEADPYVSLKNHGANCVRLQLDQLSFSTYSGQTIDWNTKTRVIADAKRAQSAGLEIFLTLKPDYDIYSDTESTSHNNIPGSWATLSESNLGQALYNWVYDTLVELAGEGIYPAIVAVGNEVNVGFLQSGSNIDNSRTGRLLVYGHKAVRDYAASFNPACLSAIHVANPALTVSYITMYESAGATDYDIVAMSYYPGTGIGHSLPSGGFSSIAESLDKKIMVIETAYTFTTGTVNGTWMGDNCDNAYNYPDWNDDSSVNEANYTPENARAWLLSVAQEIKDAGGLGLITWGTESLPADGIYTYPASWAAGSTWENNSYWDFTDNNNIHEGCDWMQDID